MSATPPPPVPSPNIFGRTRNFWHRVSEGRNVDVLWSQFTADARASYGFYMKEADSEDLKTRRGFRRWFHITKTLFWSLLMKLTPARRVLLLIAFLLLVLSGPKFRFGTHEVFTFDMNLEAAAAGVFLLLLSLELADKVTMKRDLEIAREIQSWLVPSQAPEVPGADIAFATRPQNSVAGDYYDAFYPNPDQLDRLMLVIADVAGKSVPAALLMATLQASLRTIAGEIVPLAHLVARLNRYSCAHSLNGLRFTTAVLAEYNPTTRHLTYVNAGHNNPVVRRANGTLEMLDAGGLPLGIESERNYYDTGSLDFSPGDTLILFTDGVVEAFNQAGEEFGNPRWLDAIRSLPDWKAQESLDFLMKKVDEFVGATRQSDDITCLVFRIR